MILRRRLVGGGDLPGSRGKSGFDVTALRLRRVSRTDDRWHEALRGIKPQPRRLNFVARRQQRGPFRRGLKRYRDHDRNRLVGIADAIVLQEIEPEYEGIGFCVRVHGERGLISGRHHLNDARMRLGGGDVEKRHATARDAAHRHHRIKHSRRVVVGSVAGSAGDLEDALTPGERLSHVRAVPNVRRRLCKRDIKHGRQLRKRRRKGKRAAPARARASQRRQA